MGLKGTAHRSAKLTPHIVRYMRREHKRGKLVKDLADMFGVHKNNAGKAINGQTWKHVNERG